MSDGRILNLLHTILGTSIKQGNEYLFWCPFCAKKKLSINLNKRVWKCWVCNNKGRTLFSLFRKLNVPADSRRELQTLLAEEIPRYRRLAEPEPLLMLPAEYKPLWIPNQTYEYRNALSYVLLRRISRKDIMRYRIGYCVDGRYGGRIIVPSYSEHGELNYFIARDFWGHSPYKYLNPPVSKNIVALESDLYWKNAVVLCEGIFDAMSIKLNAIPLIGKTLQPKLKAALLKNRPPAVYICLDQDATKQAAVIGNTLSKEGLSVHFVPLSGKDPGEQEFTDIFIGIQNAIPMNLKELVRLKISD